MDSFGGNLFVADTFDATVRKMNLATGIVTTLAGAADQHNYRDAVGVAARFESPRSVLPGRLDFPLAVSVLPGGAGVVFADERALLVAQF